MTVRQPLFQQNDTTDQAANLLRLLLRDLVQERHGIIQENAFRVTQRGAGANNSIDIAPGGIIIPGSQNGQQGYYYVVNDATVNLPMSTGAHGSLPRIDSVIVRVRDSFYAGIEDDAVLEYVAGTASANPSPPSLAAFSNFYHLADITVPANDNVITTADITDKRFTGSQGRATVVGGIVVCTSTTRPAAGATRRGQVIFETNTHTLRVNEGTSDNPNWVLYAVPGSGSWTNYTPTFGGLTGANNTRYGRFFKLGSIVVGVCGFVIGPGGNVTSSITASLPIPAISNGISSSLIYLGVGRAFDSSANVFFSCTAEIAPAFSTTTMFNFATAGSGAWAATLPFNWDPGDVMNMFFAYEAEPI